MVDAIHERGISAIRWCRHNDVRRTGIEVSRRLVTIGEKARRFDDEVNAEARPREFLRVPDLQHLDGLAIDRDAVIGGRDRIREDSEHRVVLQEVRHRLQRPEVVDRNDLDRRLCRLNGPKEVPTDTPKAIDSNTNW